MGTMDWKMNSGVVSKTVRSERGDGVFYEVLNEEVHDNNRTPPSQLTVTGTQLSAGDLVPVRTEMIKKKTNYLWLVIFILGLGAGTLFVNFSAGDSFLNSGDWLAETLDKIADYHGNVGFLFRILLKRAGFFSFLVIFTLLCRRNLLLYLSTAYFGFCFGTVISCVTALNGMKGMLQLLELLMPHYLMYIPAYIAMTLWFQKKKKIYDIAGRKVPAGVAKISGLILPAAMVITGCVMECYLNPLWIRFFQQLGLF